jgi:hypothetical protein
MTTVILALACCLSAHADEAIVTGRVELNVPGGKPWHGGQADTGVWLVPLSSGVVPPAADPKPSPRLVQKNKSFQPRVVILRAGTAVEFPNHDPFFHNVFSLFDGKRFDLGLYEAGGTRVVHFDKAGISYIFCNIHPEMSAVVIAVPTPYFALTDRAGNVSLPGIPPGRYKLHVWNERALPGTADAATRDLTSTAGAASFGTITLPISVAPEAPHKNKYGLDYDPSAPSNPIYEQP